MLYRVNIKYRKAIEIFVLLLLGVVGKIEGRTAVGAFHESREHLNLVIFALPALTGH